MNPKDFFKPYSPEIRGDLKEYLVRCDNGCANNSFFGPKYFFVIRDMELIIPGSTFVRVDRNPLPDAGYFVNDDFLLESNGPGHENMSLMGAERGVYDPRKILKRRLWSISGLKLHDVPELLQN